MTLCPRMADLRWDALSTGRFLALVRLFCDVVWGWGWGAGWGVAWDWDVFHDTETGEPSAQVWAT